MSTNWNKWLAEKEEYLKGLGYRRYNQNHRSEDFAYWKVFYENDEKAYQVGLLFYDWRKYTEQQASAERISIGYECMLLGNDRVDLTVSKNIELPEFEEMANTFYNAMKQYMQVLK